MDYFLKNSFFKAFLITLLYYFFYNGLYYLAIFFFLKTKRTELIFLIYPFIYLVTLLFVLILEKKIKKHTYKSKKRVNFKVIFFIIISAILYRIFEDPILRINQIFNIETIPTYDKVTSVAKEQISFFVYFVLLAPFTEELLFRKILLGNIFNKYNPYVSILYTSLLFSLIHINILDFRTTYINSIYTFIFGVVLSSIFLKSRQILYTFFFHSILNLTVFLFILNRHKYWSLIKKLNFNYQYWLIVIFSSIILFILLNKIFKIFASKD